MVMQGGISGISGQDLPNEQSARELSALMDGELDRDMAGREISRLKADMPSREAWDTYHLIGDVMRGTAITARKEAPSSGLSFGERFHAQLALEPTVLAPVSIPNRQPARGLSRKFQSYALSAAASVAAVAAVGWVAVNTLRPDAPGQLAQAPLVATQIQQQPQLQSLQPQALVPVGGPVENIHQYMLAHQGISPTTAIQGVAPYIRTVSSADE
jgi:sigma-E factor negative regulatory protein RseA